MIPSSVLVERVALADLLPVCTPLAGMLVVTMDGVAAVSTAVAVTVSLRVHGQAGVGLCDGVMATDGIFGWMRAIDA